MPSSLGNLVQLIFWLAFLGLLIVVGERALGNVRSTIVKQIQKV